MNTLDYSGLYPDLKVTTVIKDDYIQVTLAPDDGKGSSLGSLTAQINLIGDNPNKWLNPTDSLGEVSLLFDYKRSPGAGIYRADTGSIQELKQSLDLFWEEIDKAIRMALSDNNSGSGWVE